MSITSRQLDDLAEEFAIEYSGVEPILYDEIRNQYYRDVEGEEGGEREYIDLKYEPILDRFVNSSFNNNF